MRVARSDGETVYVKEVQTDIGPYEVVACGGPEGRRMRCRVFDEVARRNYDHPSRPTAIYAHDLRL